jgi:large subunit ribosomal protein L10
MRPEKQILVEEVSRHLRKSDYVFLANYERVTVVDVSKLRQRLAAEKAEFHVVKNSALRVAAKSLEYPDIDAYLTGQTAIIVGGQNPSGVAKIIKSFFDESTKVNVKVGVLSRRTYDADQVKTLADLPTLDVLRAQLLGLLSQPAQSFLFVLNGVPTSMLNLLQAKAKAGGEG